jgi:putative Ig domain-containing protein/PKD domain-containing protein/calcineurin-like phosphoesterase family protein
MTIRPPSLRNRRLLRGPHWPLALGLLALTGRLCHADPADEIHFTLMGQTAVTFDWRAGSDTLFYGLDASYGSFVVASPPNVTPFSSAGPFREAAITGLTEHALYHYRIGFDGADHTFHTPIPRGATGFRFVAQGDIGAAADFARVAPTQSMVASVYPNLVLMMGDLTYANSVPRGLAAVDAHFNDMMVWSQDVPYQPAWGNHEWEDPTLDNLANYKGRFALPNAQTSSGAPSGTNSGCCGEDWYWFDYGCIRFITVPEPFLGAWNEWATKVVPVFDSAQADPEIRYIVTLGHRPAYSTGYHPGETSLQQKMAALAANHSKYVLDLAGHSHNYERTFAQSGVVHVTAGTGGSALESATGTCKWPGGCPPPIWDASRAMHHVVVFFDVGPTHLTGTVLCGPADALRNDITCTQGSVIETFIVPGPDQAPIVTSPAAVSGNEGAVVTVNVQAADPNTQAITSLTASQLPPGAVFTPAANNQSGTLTWTPTSGQAGAYTVTFTASNALQGTSETTLTIASANQAPSAALSVLPLTGNEPLAVTASAAGSVDPEGQMSWYRFDFGDGVVAGPALSMTANHTYISGQYDVTLTDEDAGGLQGVATQHVIVAVVPPGPNLTTNPSFETSWSGWAAYNGSTLALVPGGFDGALSCSATAGVASGSFGINDSPNWVATTSAVGARYRISAWVRSEAATGQAKLRVTEFLGATKIGSTTFSNPVTLSPQWQMVWMDFITGAAGSTLDLQIVDFPVTTGETFIIDNVSIRDLTGVPVGVGDPGPMLEARSWVAPSPIVASGSLRFVTPRTGVVALEIFDTSGRRVAEPIDGVLQAGLHEVRVGDADLRLRAGLYLYRIRHAGGTMQGRFMVAR